VGFGLNAVDHLIVVPQYPAFDTKIRLLEHMQSAGGQTASAMVALRRLGLKTAYAGRFGSDPEGLFGLETLKEDGVNVDYAEVVDGRKEPDRRSSRSTLATASGLSFWDRDDRLASCPKTRRLNSDRWDACCISTLTIRPPVCG
jgi:sugar/nucleoside kinase (ribokinase family)